MIYEYALEPELVCTWNERLICIFIKDHFGPDRGRLVSRYPKRWKKLVWDAYQEMKASRPQTQREQALIQTEEKNLTELLQRLGDVMIKRHDYVWETNKPWLANAVNEHARVPFHAIIAKEKCNDLPHVLCLEDLDEEKTPLWAVAGGLSVKRKAENMANAVSAMLSNCTKAIFIDPHFGPENLRHHRTLKAFLNALMHNRGGHAPTKVEVHTSAKSAPDFFKTECENQMPHNIPHGLCVRFIRWKERQGGEKLHNRYILTDIGGVIFNVGLDEGNEGETDDVTLMDRKQYELRWNQYTGSNPAFELVDDTDIVGNYTKR